MLALDAMLFPLSDSDCPQLGRP